MRKGFTLVELSIVLVVIGLLIGGILVAQSMISTTKVQGVIRQLTQYDIAITNYQTKFNGKFPGDNVPDGFIAAGGYYSEIGYVWSDLSQGVELKNSNGSDFTSFDYSADTTFDTKIPHLNIDQDTSLKTGLFVYSVDIGTGLHNYFVYWHFASDTWFAGPAAAGPLLTKDMLALDQKIDDGLPSSGKLLGYAFWSGCISGGKYDLSNHDYGCALYLETGFTQ